MRYFEILFGFSAIILICAAAPAKDENGPAPATAVSGSDAEGLLAVDAATAHENESDRKARQYYYNPWGGLYGGYGYGGYGGYYGGYGGYGLYGYGRYPYYGYGYNPYGYSYYG